MTATTGGAPRTARTMPLRDLTAATAAPVATVRANLMPPEVIGKRRLTWLRRRLAVALVALLVLVGVGYGLARQQTSSSQDELDATRQQTSQLDNRVRGYQAIVQTQAQIAQLRVQLGAVMTSDIEWRRLLASLDAAAPAGVSILQFSGKLAGANDAATDADTALLPAGTTLAGSLDLAGTTRDYRSVAAFVDALGRIPGFVRVKPSNVIVSGGKGTFAIEISMSSRVFSGRFTPKVGK